MVKAKQIKEVINISEGAKVVFSTGEFIDLDHLSQSIVKKKETDKVIVSSLNFLYLDIDALRNVQNNIISTSFCSALGFLLLLSDKLTYLNNVLVHEDGEPMTIKSISAKFELNSKSVYNKFKKLEKAGIISMYKSTEVSFKNQKVICINPTFLRIGKQFHKSVIKQFPDLSINPHVRRNEVLNRNRGDF
jgi:DNA-binding transcriptional regulator YhcF (GntR family)